MINFKKLCKKKNFYANKNVFLKLRAIGLKLRAF
jgi:hypothetical protein